MKSNSIYKIIVCFCFSLIVYGQQKHTFLAYQFENVEKSIDSLIEIKTSGMDEALRNYQLGVCYFSINQEDESHKYFLKSKDQFAQLDSELQYDCDYYLHKTLSSHEVTTLDTTYFYLKEFEQHAKNRNSNVELAMANLEWAKTKLTQINSQEASTLIPIKLISKAENLLVHSDSTELLYEVDLLKAIVYHLNDHYAKARHFYLNALNKAKTQRNAPNEFLARNNLGRLEFENGNSQKALENYKAAELIPLNNFDKFSYQLLYKNLKDYYSDQEDLKQFKTYSLKFDSIEKEINYFNQLINLTQSEIQKREVKLSKLDSLKKIFQKNKIVYSLVIFLIFIMASYSLVRWLKSDREKKRLKDNYSEKINKLETEHKQTVNQLENVRELVIKDHIILKNKARVYLNELMYIKSEDHYLKLIAQNSNEFIRGSLKEIQQELPPNFQKCHRSYIVNQNFIESISFNKIILKGGQELPLSRTYKKNFS